MSEKLEGTIVLDGLVEGKLRTRDDELTLRRWSTLAARKGLKFSLEVSGGSFSLLADNTPVSTVNLGDDPSKAIGKLLQELVDDLAQARAPEVSSTVRSSEYRPNEEVQTLYAISQDGQVDIQQRTVEADTVKPPQPLTTREKVKTTAFGLLIAAAVLAISTLFVDYGKFWDELVRGVVPLDTEKLVIENTSMAPFMEIAGIEEGKGETIVLTLKRTAAFPISDRQYQEALSVPELSWRRRLAVESLARGYIRYEMFDKDGGFLGSGHIRVSNLAAKESIKISLPLPREKRLAKLSLGL